MDRPIHLVADSASDITPAEAQALGIDLVPLSITIGQDTYLEGELSHDRYFALTKGQVVKTSQPSVGAFSRVFEHWVEQGHQVLCVTLSSLLSGTFQSASQAAERLQPFVTVHDSLGLSRVVAAQVLAAQKLVKAGAELAVILEAMRSVQSRSHMIVQLDTLERLRQGGRAAAIIHAFDHFAKTFQIKPILTLANGELKFAHVARAFHKGMDYMFRELVARGPAESLTVVHTRIPEVASRFADNLAVALRITRQQVLVCEAGAVISSHGGEGLLGAVLVSS
ncbi:MAG: DegV family protein [Anaerolineae bacterium]